MSYILEISDAEKSLIENALCKFRIEGEAANVLLKRVQDLAGNELGEQPENQIVGVTVVLPPHIPGNPDGEDFDGVGIDIKQKRQSNLLKPGSFSIDSATLS